MSQVVVAAVRSWDHYLILSKPCSNKMIKRYSSDKQRKKEPPNASFVGILFISDSLSVSYEIMTVLSNLMTLWQFGVILT